MAPSGRQRLYLHVGLPKTGSTFLQVHLRQHRDQLGERGYSYPSPRRDSMFHAALEMTGQAHRRGLAPARVEGAFDDVVDRGRRSGRTVLVSHEIFADAGPAEVAEICRRTADLELHVVLTLRDPGSLLVASWQERVKNGRACSFAEYAGDRVPPVLLGPDVDQASYADGIRQGFAGRVDTVLSRWGSQVPPERTHVVVCPPPGGDRSLLWQRFATAVGLDPTDPALVPPLGGAVPDGGSRANSSLGVEQVAFLRQVLVALGDRLPQPGYAHVVKRWFSQGVLGSLPGARPGLPEEYVAPLDWVAGRWVDAVEASGAVVHGDLAELRVVPARGPVVHPDDVPAEAVAQTGAAAAAEMLLEVRDLRQAVRRLEAEVRRLESES